MIRRRPFQLLALAALLAAAAPAAASEVPVSVPFTIATPFDAARSLASADFDRDGDLDLAAVGEIDDDVAWWENTAGDGSAWTRHDLNTDFDQPRDVAAGDLDGDGDPDVVATAFGADRVLWWENDLGSGAACGSDFCEHTLAVLGGADALRLADVDGDGDLDVVATARAGDEVVWLENSGDGSSWTRHTIDGAIDGPQFVWVGDLDGDGDPDVLAGAGEGGGELAWWQNDLGSGAACGSDWCDHSLDTGNTFGVAAGDLDGDGDLDLLRSEIGSLAWWENDAGDGSSWTEISIATDLARLGLAAVDVDGDGDLDVAGLATDGWLENVDGDAGTWTPRSFSSDEDLFDVEPADLDGDGDLDFAAARSTADRLVWRRNETLHRSATYPTGLNIGPPLGLAAQVAAGDVDGDGDPDLVATGEFGEVRWLENDGTPNDGGWTSRAIASGLGSPHGVAATDLDGDGDLDVAICLFSDGDVVWFENDGSPADGGWTQHSVDGAFPSALRLAAADLDGDGDLDLLASSRSTGTVSWFENDGSPGDGEWTRRDVVTGLDFAQGVAAADLDGDGDLDVLAAAAGSSDLIVWFENDGSPGDGGWIEHTLGAGFDGATELAACDLDGDGDLDVPAVAEDADVVAWFENDGTPANGAWPMHTIEGLLDRPRRVVCADFDDDGDADVAATAYFANEVVVWRSDGSPADGGWQRVQVATGFAGASGLAAADLDRDGKPDFVATASLVDRVRWWRDGGGQLALPTTDRVVASNPNEGTADVLLLEIAGAHRGRAGDADAELATLELLFEETAGDPLTGAELDALVDTVRLYLDDGDAAFEPDGDDVNFFSLGSPFSLAGGALTLTLVDGDPSVQMAVGSDLTWWLAVDLTANAGSAVPGTLRVTHVTASSAGASSTGEMTTTDLPLALELQGDVSSSTLDVNALEIFADGFESGDTTAWSTTTP